MPTPKNKKIGLIVPSSNTVMEPDFYLNLPASYSLHTARMYLEEVTADTEARMLDEYTLPAARDLATLHPDVVVFGCTSAGALRGNSYENQLVEEIARQAKAPAVSVNRSVRETLKKIKAKRLVVITPYLEEINQRMRASLEQDGMQVLNMEGLGIRENTRIAQVPGEEIIALAMRALRNQHPDALFISCTNFPAVSVLGDLRRQLPFPVISSNQAVLERTIELLEG